MPIVQAIAIDGIDLFFYSNDHAPPHFHAEKPGDWEYRVCFLNPQETMLTELGPVYQHRAPKAKVLRALTSMAERARIQLLAEWESIVES